MAKKAVSAKRGTRPEGRNRVSRYLRETRAELRKVHWPSRKQAWNLTKLVLTITIVAAALLGLLDYSFALELKGIIAGSGTLVVKG